MNNYDFLYDVPIYNDQPSHHVRYRHTPNGENYYKQETIPLHQLRPRAIFGDVLDYPFKWIKSISLRTKSIFIGREFIIQIGMVALFMMLSWYWVAG